jgi:hypothetical protein
MRERLIMLAHLTWPDAFLIAIFIIFGLPVLLPLLLAVLVMIGGAIIMVIREIKDWFHYRKITK